MKIGSLVVLFYFSQLPGLPSDSSLLQGRWFKSCQAGSVKTEFFQGTTVTLDEMYFLDQSCRDPSLIFVSAGSFTIPKPGQMDFRFEQVRVRLMTARLIEDFNRRQVCGFQDWKLAEEKEISGRSCELLGVGLPQKVPAAGEMRYGIYRLDGGRLSLGQLTHEKNGTSQDRRPLDYQSRAYAKMGRVRP